MNTCVYIPLKRIANLFEDLCNFNLDRKFEIFFLLEQEFLIENLRYISLSFYSKNLLRDFFENWNNVRIFPISNYHEFMRVGPGFENLHNNYETTRTTKICMLLLRVDVYFYSFLSAGDVLYRIQLKSQWDFCISV